MRSRAPALGIAPDYFKRHGQHLHIPQGAIPKDGPSAGVAMTIALLSLLTGRLVRSDLAMTGEMTLRGKVVEVGGIKEKVLAARRAGVKTVIMPRRNEKDLRDVQPELLQGLELHFVENLDEVMALSFEPAIQPSDSSEAD